MSFFTLEILDEKRILKEFLGICLKEFATISGKRLKSNGLNERPLDALDLTKARSILVGNEDVQIDRIDRMVLRLLQADCRIPLHRIARKLGVPKSTIHYRVRRLTKKGMLEGFYAKLNSARLGFDYLAVVLVRAKYGPKYHERVGQRLARVRGVWAVYYVLGDIDFIVLIRAKSRDDYMAKLESISSMPDIERTSTQVVAKVVKEDSRINL